MIRMRSLHSVVVELRHGNNRGENPHMEEHEVRSMSSLILALDRLSYLLVSILFNYLALVIVLNHLLSQELLLGLLLLLLLAGALLAERCRTDDLLPSILISCLPPCRMDPKGLRVNILINCSQLGGSRSSNESPPVCWWS